MLRRLVRVAAKDRHRLAGAGGGGFGALGEGGFDVIAVGAGDDFELDFFGAGGFAFADVGAVGETFDVHLLDHGESAAVAFHLALRQVAKMGDLGADEESGGGVGAGRDAGAATDAGGGVHGEVGILLVDGDGVAVGGAAGGNGDEAAGGDDAVERAAVHGEILDDGKGLGAPGLEVDLVAVFEVAHVELADGGALEAAVGFAVDHDAAHAADAFAAIVVEGDGIFALLDEALVEDVEHFEEGHVLVDVGDVVADHAAFVLAGSSGARREE